MWIKLIGANFSTNNIGTLTSYKVNTTGLVGLTVNPKYVNYTNEQKSQTKEFIITPLSGYVLKANNTITCTHSDGSTTDSHIVTEDEVTAGQVAWTITLDSDIAFVGVAEKVAEPDVPTPDPEDPVNYTFTINPDPISATVTLSATGYSTVSGTGSKSITVANGTKVSWSVSADGYTTRTGNWTISGGNKTENIVLVTSATPVNLWKYSSSDMDAIMTNARYRLTSGLPYKEEGDPFDDTYGTTEKIYVNGNSGTYNLNLQSGKTYRWQFIPYFEYGFLKLHNPWGGPEQTSMKGKRVFFYKADDTLIENDSKCLDSTGMLVTVPAGAVYMRFMCWGYTASKSKVKPLYDTLMITEGETEYSEYVPYQG